MKARVFVTLKQGLLDTAGQAVLGTLERLSFDEVKQVRIGKYIELTLDDVDSDTDDAAVKSRIEDMCKKLLANAVMEDYRIEVLPS